MSLANRRTKAKIKPPRKLAFNENVFNESWEKLSRAISEIHRKNTSNLSYEELYRTAYYLVINKSQERLYNGVKQVIADHLEEVARDQVVPAFVVGQSGDGSSFLKVLIRVWEDHTTCMHLIRDIMMYLDGSYPKLAQVPPVYDMGLELFRDTVVRSPRYPIQEHMFTILLDLIRREREGEVIDRSSIKAVTDMLLELPENQIASESVYQTGFEKEFLAESREFYRVEGQMLVGKYDAPEYLKKVEKRLNEEDQRIRHYLSSMTEGHIRNIVETELIANHIKTVMEMENSGLKVMLDNKKLEDIGRMYKLFMRVPTGLRDMQKFIGDYIRELGRAINSPIVLPTSAKENNEPVSKPEKTAGMGASSAAALRWVQEVLALKSKFDEILRNGLNSDKSFQTTFNEAFSNFINNNPKSPEYISLFIDENLKKGIKGKSDDEVDSILDETISLFRFVQEKDVFERYYKQHLAKRLLGGRSVSDDAERNMLSKLKLECGCQFTSKLEGMFQDMRTSAETMLIFRQKAAQANLQLELNVNVLTSTFWPMNSNVTQCNMPPEVQAACEVYKQFYLSRHSGRRIAWQYNLGTAEIRAHFDTRKHELSVSTYAMVVLLLFNNLGDGNSLSFTDIQQETEIEESDLRRTLQSLACGKYKILLKTPKGREIGADDRFVANWGFTCPLARIKIQTVAAKVESEPERRETIEKVEETRKHQIEAAIVRIMKDRKTMEHNQLVAEVTRQLTPRFVPVPGMIKKRIETLIDREYLERASGDRKMYNYLA
ncbi:uncharacterized protein VTP21DRAFT_5715 [Calcarisporiella thermophila]|uniref:uncharacterized protein n=1 Tax=Calcarisporiella thermophila TaxID=911321 RepID=UPI003744AC4F